MKMRFRKNSLRLRLNQQEVFALAKGETLEEGVQFPGAVLTYRLTPVSDTEPNASLADSTITVFLPKQTAARWEAAEDIGIYYRVGNLEVAIEKDLECTDGPPEERDPYAYPRKAAC
jgi:hypothetical protein